MSEIQQVVANSAEAKTNVISVENPTPEVMEGLVKEIKANYDFNVDVRPVRFNFKKSKDKDTGIETVREAVELPIPYPSVQGLIDIITKGGKGLELVMEAVASQVDAAARDLLYDDVKMNAATFPVNKVAWEYIANLPKAQRRGGGIPKETWEAFAQDYIEIMPEKTGKTIDQVTRAAKLLLGKFTAVKTNEAVINLLLDQLTIYADSTKNMDDFGDCVAFLVNKADTLLNVTEEELLANL